MFLGIATKAVSVPVPVIQGLLIGLSVYELFVLFFKRDEKSSADSLDISQIIRQTLDSISVETDLNEICSAYLTRPHRRVNRDLDIDAMNEMYVQYGERGVYAYLIENGIAHDRYHGEFIIQDLFLPEREKLNLESQDESEACLDI